MRREYLAGSTNFETFMGCNEPADTKKVVKNLRRVFNDSDALVNSQAGGEIIKGNFLDGTGGDRPKSRVGSSMVNVKRTKYVIKDCPELREEDEEDGSRSSGEEEDGSRSSGEEESEDLVDKIK
jgi:hypothetical protein